MTEKEIETQILTWLNLQPGVFAFKINTVGIYDERKQCYRKNRNRFVIPGTSDIVGLIRGRFVAIEVKTPVAMRRFKNYPTPSDIRQKDFLGRVLSRGGIALSVCSLDEVMAFFQKLTH